MSKYTTSAPSRGPGPQAPAHPEVHAYDAEDKSPWLWIWNGRYLKVDSTIAGTKQTTKKVVIVSVPGVLTQLVNYRPVDAVPCLGERVYEINSKGRSWELDDGPMGAACELLWDVMVEQKLPLTGLPSVKKAAEFPYAFNNGKPALLCTEGTQKLVQQHNDKVQRICHLCGERPGNWHAHISTHILRSIRGVKEDLRGPIGTNPPCGFCAKSGKPGSKSTPCRNVPVVCRLCFPDAPRPGASQLAQWRYNMPEHLSIAHPEYASPGTRLPHEVWVSMEVDAAEELALGIPKVSIPAVFKDVAGPDEGLNGANQAGKKRKQVNGAAPRQKRARVS
ncbi:hypothetical protein B0H14DRAFT_2590529 [Mycena olivaceomarginata]|nr:hypothetical protein B0H14DRAFT_2590529 [Mycena olivaceomarginata]